jgi:hypothetical protein
MTATAKTGPRHFVRSTLLSRRTDSLQLRGCASWRSGGDLGIEVSDVLDPKYLQKHV